MPLVRSTDDVGRRECDAHRVKSFSMRRPAPPQPPLRPLRVLLTTDWWEPVVNGVVASVTTLRRELQSLGCDVRVLTLSPGIRTRSEEGVYRLASVNASMVYDRARIGMPASRPVLKEILAWGPDVVHSQCEFSTYVWARRIARQLDVPLVHTYHTIYEDYTHYYSPSRTVGRKVVQTFSRKVLDRTDAVVVPTRKVAEILDGYGVTRPVHVIPTGLDLERFRPARTSEEHADAAALRASLGILPRQEVVLSVSRLAKEKNLDEVLERFATIDRADAVLVLVGDGPHREALAEHAERLGIASRVRFAGVVDPSEVHRWYRIGDLFVSASLSETQGLTFIEAMSCGLPLLCRRDPSLAHVVIDGRTGWQYDDAGGFVRLASALLDDPSLRERMSRASVEHARSTCGSAAFGRDVLEMYRELLESRRSRLRQGRILAPRRQEVTV